MKNFIKSIGIVFLIIMAILHSCKKDKTTPPVLTTAEPTEITQKTVRSGGNITSDGGEEIIIAGICWSTSANPSVKDKHTNDAKESGSFTSRLEGLTPDTRYYLRAYAYNKADLGYGNEVTFTTSPIALATLTTAIIDSITYSTAICGGNITFDGGGAIIERGICWAVHQNPTTNNDRTLVGIGTGSFTSEIKCLSFATTYYVRAYATNSAGTAYGDQLSFTTQGTNPIIFNPDLIYGYIQDIDGNCYKTIQIGDQTWMAENLKTTRYNDGSPIPNVVDPDEWINLLIKSHDPSTHELTYEITGAFCWYNNDSAANENDYGKLYNFGAAESGKICPAGWHVPDADEWSSLCNPYRIIEFPIDPNNPYGILGNELMERGTNHWDESLGTNETGFTALPGGLRDYSLFNGIGIKGYYWSSDRAGISYGTNAAFRPIPFGDGYGETPLLSILNVTKGLSIRCKKD